jgi:hypothetical protein
MRPVELHLLIERRHRNPALLEAARGALVFVRVAMNYSTFFFVADVSSDLRQAWTEITN